jgi:hypothetical protein
MTTIEDAKQFLRTNWDEGVKCPCCIQKVKRYKRKLTSGMASGLISLYKQADHRTDRHIHISKLGHLNGGEFAQLNRWGLIEDLYNDSDDKRTSGKWRITDRGVSFVRGLEMVASHVYTYNGETLGFEQAKIDIHSALGSKFNYKEIMGVSWV